MTIDHTIIYMHAHMFSRLLQLNTIIIIICVFLKGKSKQIGLSSLLLLNEVVTDQYYIH